MAILILLPIAALWLGLGVVLWRWVWIRRMKRAPLAMPWMVLLAVAWMVGPWVDEIWGSWVFKRECEAMPESIYNIPVAVGAGEFYDEQGNRKLWAYDEIMKGKSPHSPKNLPLAVAEEKKFVAAYEREFRRATSVRKVRWFPIPIVEQVTQVESRTTGVIAYKSWLIGSSGGWVKRLVGWGAHGPYMCIKPGPASQSAMYHDFIKFK